MKGVGEWIYLKRGEKLWRTVGRELWGGELWPGH